MLWRSGIFFKWRAELEKDSSETKATLTRAGFVAGCRDFLPFTPGVIVFGASFGALAAQKGLTLAQTAGMSGFIFAGASQLVGLQRWAEHWSIGAIAAVAGVVAAVNSRLLLMSAAFRPLFGSLPPGTVYPNLLTLTDVNWAITVHRQLKDGQLKDRQLKDGEPTARRDFGVVIGAGAASWLLWLAATLVGFLLGGLVADPRRYGLDLVIVFTFAAMAVPLLKRATSVLPYVVTALVSVAMALALPGFWFIVCGALAGALTAALRHPPNGRDADV